MKRYLLLMPVILATTAAIADTRASAPSSRADAQAQAAALLSRPHSSGSQVMTMRSLIESLDTRATADAQAQAAALLSGVRHWKSSEASSGRRTVWRTTISGRARAGSSVAERFSSFHALAGADGTHAGSARTRRAL